MNYFVLINHLEDEKVDSFLTITDLIDYVKENIAKSDYLNYIVSEKDEDDIVVDWARLFYVVNAYDKNNNITTIVDI